MRLGYKIKKRILLVLPIALLLLSSGCGKLFSRKTEQEDTSSFTVYYSDLENTGLVGRKYTPTSQTFDGILNELLDQFSHTPSTDVISALPGGVQINNCTMGVDNLTVDFNASYLGLNNVQEVLLRAGLVRTLVQLPGVVNVSVTVDSQPLLEPDGTPIGAMSEDTFVDTRGDEINSYRQETVNLYFSTSDGEQLTVEPRTCQYSTNLILEQVIVENIIKGPTGSSMLAVANPDTSINSVVLEDGICLVDLNSKFNETYQTVVSPEIALYAFVNAVMDLGNVEGVRFAIDGDSTVRFRSQISLDQTFVKDDSLVLEINGQGDS